MGFSFFKKQDQKMPERPAARPRPPEPEPELIVPAAPLTEPEPAPEVLPDLEFTAASMLSATLPDEPTPSVLPPTLNAAIDDLDFTGDDFADDFTESSVMGIDVAHDGDPVQADIEHVVVLFANGQDAVARSLLISLIYAYSGSDARRFWGLLFDLLQAQGDREAFENLGLEFAEACETSPPTWRQEAPLAVSAAPGALTFGLQGVLTAEGAQPVAELAALVAQRVAVSVDCGKLLGCDDAVAGQLADLLRRARQSGAPLRLENIEGFLARLNERLQPGEATRASSWLLLLELLQRHGTQEAFEERAVDYAVTFELSPPSWETVAAASVASTPNPVRDDACYLSGELKNERFEALTAVFAAPGPVLLDFSGVRRMDFYSAGQLVNRLAPYQASGREIVIRSPNHLVAELMAVVGLNKLARIIVPKS